MRTALAAALLAALLSAISAAAADQPTAVGFWRQTDESGRVGGWFFFAEHDGVYDGRLVKMFPKPGEPIYERCTACSGSQKNAPMLGLTIIRNMRRNGLNYQGGTILDPRDGSVYQAEMALSRDNMNLSVRGFLGISLFGQTQVWKRLPANSMPQAEIPREQLSPSVTK